MGDKNFKWWVSDSEDAEIFSGPYDTRDAAISEGESLYEGEQFYIVEADKTVMSSHVDGEAYAERIMEDLCERIMLHPENIDAWNPATDEGKMPPVPPRVALAGVDVPVINLVQAKPRSDSVYLRVVIIDPADDSVYPVVRYRVANDGSGNPGEWVEQRFPNATPSGGFINMSTSVVPANTLLDIQVAFIASDGDYGDWSVTANVTSTIDPNRPATPTNMTAVNSAGTVTVSAKAANDNTRYLVFKRGTSSQTFAQATLIGQYNVSANQIISFTDAPGTGTWKYWCGAENNSGIASLAQASQTVTV